MHDLTALLQALHNGSADFEDALAFIAAHYDYTPTAFSNGLLDTLHSAAGQNEGSCRIFALGLLENLSAADTLACFGRHYRDVLADPQGQAHGNIRRFMTDGWAGIRFAGPALQRRH